MAIGTISIDNQREGLNNTKNGVKKKESRTDVLRHREFVRGSVEILQPRGDKAPLHEGSPEEDGLGPCWNHDPEKEVGQVSWALVEKFGGQRTSWMVHECLEFGRGCACCCSRHFGLGKG